MQAERLVKIGFERIGFWKLDDDSLIIESNHDLKVKNAIYAFVIKNEVMYVGKTTNTLKKRFYGYKKPGKTQNTNIGVNRKLKKYLKESILIEILIFEDKEFLKWGEFDINLAEGLEKSIIDILNPCWNGRGNKVEL